MKSRQTWFTAGTAAMSFALGVAAATALRKPDWKSDSSNPAFERPARETSRSESGNGEAIGRTRAGTRDERKRQAEPRISVPLKTVARVAREQQLQGFKYLGYSMEKVLLLVGASERETEEIKALIKRSEAAIYAQEKTHLKAIQTDDAQIRLDSSSMDVPAKAIAQQTQEGIRSVMPPDMAGFLISLVSWENFYPTGEQAYPVLSIERSTSGKMTAWARDSSGGHGYPVDPKFADDGNPIPADQVFDDRWKPFLKGLTLLPQNEK